MKTQLPTRTLDEVIRDLYVDFNIPVDRIVASPALSRRFTSFVNRYLPGAQRTKIETVNWRLMTLRKRGEEKGGLPRLERQYFGRETKPDRKPKPR